MNKPIFYITVLSLLLFFGGVFFWQPEYRDFTELRLLVDIKEKELNDKSEYFSRLRDLSVRLLEFDSEVAKIESALPEFQDIPETLNFIARASSRSGLLLQNLDIGRTAPLSEGSSITKTEITFSLLGPYPAFRSFLSELENSARLIATEDVSFKQQSAAGTEIFLFTLKARTQSLKGL